MKKKILVLCLILGMSLMWVSCASSVEADCDYKISQADSDVRIRNYTDPETGVCYLIYTDNLRSGCGGITVRYNADGSIMVKGD